MYKESNLKDKTIAGVKITTAMTAYRGFIEFGSSLILIRILAPEIFGSMVFALLVVNFVGMLSNLSSSSAIIQRKEEDINDYLDVAFTSELILSIFFCLLLFCIAPSLIIKFGKPELSFFTQINALIIPVNKLSFPSVIFRRNLNFTKEYIGPAISLPLNFSLTIFLAFLGFGIWIC